MYAGQYLDSTTGLYYMQARWYDPVTGQFLSLDPLVGATQAPYYYATDDPVNEADPSGLSVDNDGGGMLGPSAACWLRGQCNTATIAEYPNGGGPSLYGVLLADLNSELPLINKVSGDIAGLASICAIFTSEFVIGALTCGGVALVASGVNEATSITLAAEGRESPQVLALDTIGFGSAGLGYVFEVGGKSAAAVAQSTRELSNMWRTTAQEARWWGKLGPAAKAVWYRAKASAWEQVSDVLSAISRSLAFLGAGTSAATNVVDGIHRGPDSIAGC
jgi:RHS repeat-associated protein